MPSYEYDKDYPFAAFITNLGKYNEGYLVGEWVRFPTTAEEMKKVFERIGIGQKDEFGCVYEEWFVTDYDCYVEGLYDKLGEYVNLDELNYFASKLDEMSQDEYERFQAAVDMGDHTHNLQDLINLCDNLDCYEFYPDITDDDDLGRYYLDEVDPSLVPEHLKNYIDYEAYGRDIRFSEGGEYTDHGYCTDSGSSFHEFYDGMPGSVPEEYRVMSFPEDDLSQDELSEWAMDIAFDMDEFFRQNDPQYAAEHPEAHAAKEEIYENLTAGKIAAYEKTLEAMGQAQDGYLLSELTKYKEASGYEEFLDIDVAAVREAIQNPDQPHIDEMLAFAVQAEREYAAEAAAFTPTPETILAQAREVSNENTPDDHLTGERIQTPRGTFHLTDLTKEQMEEAGYGVHHNSDDGKYLVMGNGTRAFAVRNPDVPEQDVRREAAMNIAVDVDRLCRAYEKGYSEMFPRADYQQEIIAARMDAGETHLFKTQLINLHRPEETADTIGKIDAFEKEHGINTYMVYQLRGGDELRDIRHESLEYVQSIGKTVDPANYELVYAGPLTPAETAETIYTDLNVHTPVNLHAPPLGMSDVLVFREYGKDTAHYCDRFGFAEVPEFLNPQLAREKENPLRTAEMTVEDDYGMIDGVLNNGRRDEQQAKPSIKERLAEAKKICAERPAAEKGPAGRSTPEHSDL